MKTMDIRYKSLVFFDLETTDLPQFRPSITELAFTACSLEHFESSEYGESQDQLPRVLHKLTLCVNPIRKIPHTAVEITGLNNFLLEQEKPFDSSSAALIRDFILQLQQPVCLIAHNGSQFDFPLFARTLQECDSMISIDCIDSLQVFKKIDEDNARFIQLLDAELAEAERDDVEQSVEMQTVDSRSPSPDMFAEEDGLDDSVLSEVTQEAEKIHNLSTPNNKGIPRNNTAPGAPVKPRAQRFQRHTIIPRRLFSPSYALSAIYERNFNRPPENAHRAEEDTLILMKCARFQAKEFSINIPAFAKPLSSYYSESMHDT